jgi:hypothetical protein
VTATRELATIEKVDIREVWENEARDFTPWLADNLQLLGKVLEMDLEEVKREAGVGRFSLDILARDVGRDRPVVIENQLGVTDHSHLGQLLTYAAGYDANVVIWIAAEFKDEHREALDLLNRRTGEDSQFFGVVVELWKIDESRPAVNFKLVSTPNEWAKQTVGTGRTTGTASERMERYREFFQKLIDVLREKHRFTNAKRGQPQNWYSFSSGKSAFTYGANFNADGRARVELYVDSGERERNKRIYEWFANQKESFESNFEEPLKWEPLDSRRGSRISVVRQGSIDDDQKTLEEIHDWMIEKLLAFKQVFGPKLDELVE